MFLAIASLVPGLGEIALLMEGVQAGVDLSQGQYGQALARLGGVALAGAASKLGGAGIAKLKKILEEQGDKMPAELTALLRKMLGEAGEGAAATQKGLRGAAGEEGEAAGSACRNGTCFPAGTKVLMADGSTKTIEDIEEGDWVLADDPEDKDGVTARQVIQTHENWTQRLIHVEIDEDGDGRADGEFAATGMHPIWTQSRGWVYAKDLLPGDLVESDDPTHTSGPIAVLCIGEERYWVVNPLTLYECVDDARSVTTRWTEEDERPDKVGQYRMVITLALDGKRIHNDSMFRVEEWEVTLVVNEDLKRQMEQLDTTGILFRPLAVSD